MRVALTSTLTTFFWIDKDLGALDQHCDCNCWSIDAVESTQNGILEQVATLVCRVDKLEAHSREQCLHIQEVKQKVEEGEETLLKCIKALKMMSARACHCNEGAVASGSGIREESLELEYASEDEEFRMLSPDLMTLVLEGERYQGIFSYFFSREKID